MAKQGKDKESPRRSSRLSGNVKGGSLKKRKTVVSKKLQKVEKEKPVFECDYCHKQFSCSSKLKEHLAVHTGKKDHHCNLCDFSSAYKRHLTVHIRRHLIERPFKCKEPHCGADFSSSGELKCHELVHSKTNKRFSCDRCPYKSHAKLYLTRHMKSIHSESRDFQCPQEGCEYAAKTKDYLNRHLMTHSENKNQVCPQPNCGFTTKWAESLKRHVKTHVNEEKKYKCNLCDYSSHQHGNLVLHIRRHTRETPFSCQLCSFKSKAKSDLNQHLKIHSNGEKRVKCRFCDFSTHYHRGLIIHIRQHTGETPYACDLCPYESKKKANLKLHMKNHARN